MARKKEADLEQQWWQARPTILGELLTLVAGVIHTAPSVRLDSKPRMADFAQLVAALDQLLDSNGLDRYLEQGKVMAEDSLSSDPFLVAMAAAELEFTGTSAQLLDALTPSDERKLPRDWPKNARAVTGLLKRNAPPLRKVGWVIEANEDLHTKVTEWTFIPPEKAGNSYTQYPHSPQTAGVAGVAGNEYGQSQDAQATTNGATAPRALPVLRPAARPTQRVLFCGPVPCLTPRSRGEPTTTGNDHERAITTISETLGGKVVSRTFKMYPAHFFDRENEVGERWQPVYASSRQARAGTRRTSQDLIRYATRLDA